ncbi:MAG: ATP-binding protein, partial [Myxococcota bacterium]
LASTTEAVDSLEKTNRELIRANDQLKELDQLKSNFIATVSHELRTPLTSVIGYSEMLIEGMAGELSEEQTDYVRTILEKGESLLTLIGQVLDLSRIESGNVMMNREATDVQELAELSVSDILPQATKRKLQVEVHVAEDVEPIPVDRDKVRRVITNLLGNAVKFTPEGGRIQVLATVVEEEGRGEDRFDMFEPERIRCLKIEVVDSGIGIPKDKLERIFDTFYQVDNSSTRQFGGTGLGLSIARNFVVAHNGHIDVHSELGRGSTFSFVIPYRAEEREDVRVQMEGIRFDEH